MTHKAQLCGLIIGLLISPIFKKYSLYLGYYISTVISNAKYYYENNINFGLQSILKIVLAVTKYNKEETSSSTKYNRFNLFDPNNQI